MGDWLADRRTEAAAERILDAAEQLFTRHDAAAVGMNEIARAAGCSRATLYRYFENRDALYSAYVHRETNRLFAEIGARLAEMPDARDPLVEGALLALRRVRDTPALVSWFAATASPIGAQMAERSDVIHTLVEGFLAGLGDDQPGLTLRARWLVRVLISLLQFPGRDDADERAMLETFVAPTVGGYLRQPSRRGP